MLSSQAPPRQPPAARLLTARARLRAAAAARAADASPLFHAPRAPAENLQKLAAAYQANGCLVYLRQFFDPEVFEAASAECARLRNKLRRERSSIAENRLGAYLSPASLLHSLFAAPSVAARLSAVTGEALSLSDYPLELRSYPSGASMAWHRDEPLFVVPQVELVLTVWNSSDSTTEWQDAGGRMHSQRTEPNSVLALRAAGCPHRVLPVKRGERGIVKVVFSTTRERTEAYAKNMSETYLD